MPFSTPNRSRRRTGSSNLSPYFPTLPGLIWPAVVRGGQSPNLYVFARSTIDFRSVLWTLIHSSSSHNRIFFTFVRLLVLFHSHEIVCFRKTWLENSVTSTFFNRLCSTKKKTIDFNFIDLTGNFIQKVFAFACESKVVPFRSFFLFGFALLMHFTHLHSNRCGLGVKMKRNSQSYERKAIISWKTMTASCSLSWCFACMP